MGVAGSAHDRLSRGFALEFENYEERRKFEDSLGEGLLARRRIGELLTAAEQLGLTTATEAGTVRLRTTVPSYIDLLKVLPGADPEATSDLDDSWVYRLLSGYAHAKAWATTLGIGQVVAQGGCGVAGRVEAVEIERLWGTDQTVDASV